MINNKKKIDKKDEKMRKKVNRVRNVGEEVRKGGN